MTDYRARIKALRALGAEGSGATDHERALANQRASELEAKHGIKTETSPITDDTTVTGRDGRRYPVYEGFWFRWTPPPSPESEEVRRRRYEEAVRQTESLFKQQWQWNPPPDEDEDSMYEEAYKYAPDDYEGYNYESQEDG